MKMIDELISFLTSLRNHQDGKFYIGSKLVTISPAESVPKSREQKYLYLLDAGHGGVSPYTGKYTTAPSKMYRHKDFTFLEGVFNREVMAELEEMLKERGINYKIISHDWQDTPLQERAEAVNAYVRKRNKCVLFSIHGNAASSEKATGLEFFTSKGQTLSDVVADEMIRNAEELIPELPLRKDTTDGDGDKEANFYILRKTFCAAVLGEFGFFTNPEEAKLMLSKEYQVRCAKVILKTIEFMEASN